LDGQNEFRTRRHTLDPLMQRSDCGVASNGNLRGSLITALYESASSTNEVSLEMLRA
jgi:hypothetical protein